jgi:hypothetical protein
MIRIGGCGAHLAKRARLSAFHRDSRLGEPTPLLSFGTRFLGKLPVQRAPRRPVIVPAGRIAEAAPARGYESRAEAPPLLHQPAVTGDALIASKVSQFVT